MKKALFKFSNQKFEEKIKFKYANTDVLSSQKKINDRRIVNQFFNKLKDDLRYKLKNILIEYNSAMEPIFVENNLELLKFFNNVSNGKGLLDPLKLKTIIYDVFKEFSDKIWPII